MSQYWTLEVGGEKIDTTGSVQNTKFLDKPHNRLANFICLFFFCFYNMVTIIK